MLIYLKPNINANELRNNALSQSTRFRRSLCVKFVRDTRVKYTGQLQILNNFYCRINIKISRKKIDPPYNIYLPITINYMENHKMFARFRCWPHSLIAKGGVLRLVNISNWLHTLRNFMISDLHCIAWKVLYLKQHLLKSTKNISSIFMSK